MLIDETFREAVMNELKSSRYFAILMDGSTDEIVDAISEDSKIVMFADDIALYRAIRSPLDFILLQLDVDAICNWIALNYLKLNILKCCYMIFTQKEITYTANYPTCGQQPRTGKGGQL